MKRTLKYLKPYRWGVALVFLLVAARAVLDLLIPTVFSSLIEDGIGLGETSVDPSVPIIIRLAIIMLAITIVSIIVTIIGGYFESKVSAGFGRDLRKAVYKKVEQFSLQEMDHFTTASLITRTTNDIQQLQSYVNMLLRMIILQPIMAIGAISFSIALHPSLSVLIVAAVASSLVMIVIVYAITLPRFNKMQLLVDKLNLVTRENLSGLRVVRAYNTQEFQAERIDQTSKASMKLNIFTNRVMSIMWPFMGLIMGLSSLGIIYFSQGYLGIDGYGPAQMQTLMQYTMRAIMSFMFLTMMFIMVPRAMISAKRISEVLDMEIQIKDPADPVALPEKGNGEVVFRNVSFKYPDANAPVLSNISFVAPAGKTTAFIGSTGSGKSTLINLIPRFYERTEGTIEIDGVDIKNLKLEDLYYQIGYVPQKGILFSGTIRENILFGKEQQEGQEEILEKSANIAQAKQFINQFEEGYQHQIAQGGVNVSGGQRQRLSIARAIAKQPLIYIFDDSFSALDYKTDQKLRSDLANHVHSTKLIVAQRINTIRHADHIVVLDQGAIVGQGTHHELMETCPIYQEIAFSQLSKEELA